MDLKLLATVFGTVFIAEIADKTQLATLLFAADARHSKWIVFAGSALALVVAAALSVALGAVLARYVDPQWMNRIAGAAFIAVGVVTIWKA